MDITLLPNSLLYSILALFYLKLCRSVMLDRALTDEVDLISLNNCNGILNSNILQGRCRCSFGQATIISQNHGQIACVLDDSIDKSKYS